MRVGRVDSQESKIQTPEESPESIQTVISDVWIAHSLTHAQNSKIVNADLKGLESMALH